MMLATTFMLLFGLSKAASTGYPDCTNLMLWNMIPDDARSEIVKSFVNYEDDADVRDDDMSTPFSSPFEDRATHHTDLAVGDFLEYNLNKSGGDWYKTAMMFLLSSKNFSSRSQNTLFTLIMAKASPIVVKKILRNIRYVREDIFQEFSENSIINLVLNTRLNGKEMINIFKVLQMYTGLDLTKKEHLSAVRCYAFKTQNRDLLLYTEEFPEFLDPLITCQKELLESWGDDEFNQLWDCVCVEDTKHVFEGPACYSTTENKFVKFITFSDAVNTCGWNAAMFAIASQKYDIALGIPSHLVPPKSAAIQAVDEPIQTIQQLIPFVEHAGYRGMLSKKFNADASTRKTSFNAPDCNNKICTIRAVNSADVKFDYSEKRPQRTLLDVQAYVEHFILSNEHLF